MFQRHTIIAEMRRMMIMATPLIGAQLLQMGNGLVDAIVAGRLGRAELAAGGLGAGIWFFASLGCIGLMAGLSPILSEMIGNRRRNAVGDVFRQGLWLGVTVGCISAVVVVAASLLLSKTSIEAELVPLVQQYLWPASLSLPAFAVVLAARNVCEATGLTRPVLLVQLLGLLINIVVDLTIGLGLFGFPRLGLFGIGLATSIVTVCMAIALLLLLRRPSFARYNLFARLDRPQWVHIKPILVLALPIFFGLLFEAGLFFAASIQAGIIGTLAASVHFIALGVGAFCYMLPLGLSFALTARVGRVYGRALLHSLQLRVLCGVLLTFGMAIVTVSLLLLFRHQIPAIYTRDIEVRELAATLLLGAALFQLSDGLQVCLIGMLRGLQDTRVPMFINAFSYWAIAFGTGYYLAHHAGFGIFGLWAGLVTGLTVAALLLALRLRHQMSRVQGNFVQAN